MAGSDVGVSVPCPGFVRTRLGDSTRARPERFGGPVEVAPGESFILDIARGLVDAGTPAADVADAVVDAIRTRRFWILTHDEYHEPVVARFHAAVDGTAPSSPLG